MTQKVSRLMGFTDKISPNGPKGGAKISQNPGTAVSFPLCVYMYGADGDPAVTFLPLKVTLERAIVCIR